MKINVVQLIGSFHQGGSERQAVQLIKLLDKIDKYRIFPVCLNKDGILRKEIENLGYVDLPEYRLTSFYDTNMLRQVRRMVGFLRENEIKIIQTHDYYTNIFGMFAGALAQIPVRIAAKRDTGTKTSKQQFIERRAYNLAHAIVVNSKAVKKYLLKSGVPENKINVVYNGLDFERLTISAPESRLKTLESFGLPTDHHLQFVTIVANLRSEVKNHRMFLRMAKRVSSRFENVKFILAGEGQLLDVMKSLAEDFGIQNSTYFIGGCRRIPELLSVSDICVLSSKTEGFSNSILEYMFAGKPVVATRVGGADEAVINGRTGFLVESDDDQAMASRIIELLLDPEKAEEMGKRGREVVKDIFSPEAQTEKTLTLYNSLLSKI